MNRQEVIDGPAPTGMPGAGPLLEVRDIKTHFRSPRGMVRAVDGVSFSLERGRTLGIVGESGSGKSVLSRSIMGLLPRTAERSGNVLFEGKDISELSGDGYRDLWGTEMAMVFQDPMTALNPVMRVGHQITESLRFHLDMDKGEAKETAIALLRAVEIPEPDKRFRSYPHEMSGGMRQRVVIAVALACGPKLLFADEPTTALDVTVQAQILDLLGDQQRERYMAMILVTHDLGVVAGRAHDIAVMYAGRVVEKAPTAVLFRRDADAVHRGAAVRHPQADRRLPHPAGGHRRPAPGPGQPAHGLCVRPRCPYAQDRCREEEPTAAGERHHPGPLLRLLLPGRLPETQEVKDRLEAQRMMAMSPPPAPPTPPRHRPPAPPAPPPAPRHRRPHPSTEVRPDGRQRNRAPATARRGPAPGGEPGRGLPGRPGPQGLGGLQRVASTSPRARPSAWWASPGAASRPPARPSCSCRPPPGGRSASTARS